MENFYIVARQVWMLFALIGAGAVCRRMRLLDDAAVRGMVNVLVLAVTPCLIIDVFQRPFDSAMLGQLGLAFVVALVAHFAVILFATFAVRRGGEAARPVLRLSMVFSNAGFMGIPLEQAIFGDKGVFFGVVYVAVFNLFIWSWGLREMMDNEGGGQGGTEERHYSFLRFLARNYKTFANPGTVGLAIGLPLFLCSIRLPGVVAEPIGMMASMNTPLAMLVIGYYLAGAHLRAVVRSPGAYIASFVRLVAYPLCMVAALYPLRTCLDREMMLAMVTAASAPVAAMVAMFAAKHGRDVDLAVGLVSGTTLLSLLSMPAIIALSMSILG